MTKEFFEEFMQLPSCSKHEDMVQEFLLEWGKAHGCKTKKDAKGNIYLEKGSGIRPCLINHIDTVHSDQKELVKQKMMKKIIWNGDHVTAENPLTGKQTGLGMDNQGGACIALAVVNRLPAVKAIFTVEEEIGMLGIKEADMHFFDDAAFVISNDSPDENRATHYSSGVQLYSDDFFEKWLQPTCAKHGVTSFRSEPWTCIKIVRSTWTDKDGKHLECLNFGNAGDNPHSDQEGASFKGVCNAEELLYDLCTSIPCDKQHVSDIKEEPRTWSRGNLPSFASYAGYGDESDDFNDDLPLNDDWQLHDDTDLCQFIFTYDDKEQYDKHKELCEGEGILISFDKYESNSSTAMAEGELQEMKSAYILWYQLFYDDPTVKTWDELSMVDDLEDFSDGIIFPDDPLDALDNGNSAASTTSAKKKEEKKEENKASQMDFWEWIQARKRGEV